MKRPMARWACLLAAGVVVGPVAAVIAAIPGPDGGCAATALLSASPITGLCRALAAVLLAAGAGIVAARLTSWRTALATAGVVLAWPAFHTGRLDEIIRRQQSPGVPWTLAAEGLVLAAAGFFAVRSILRQSRLAPEGPASISADISGAAAAAATGLFAAGLVAQNHLAGQCFAAALAAGLFGGLVGHVAVHHASTLSVVTGLLLLAPLAPALAALRHGGGYIDAVYALSDLSIGRPMPMDWIAGVLLGSPLGIAWATSLVDRGATPRPTQDLQSPTGDAGDRTDSLENRVSISP
ncbi:MAG: hypothetical protein IBJ11_02280 [Phycisphaerales bacterium]|nr:hypothetical protein [Phycisphaerales bacterium]